MRYRRTYGQTDRRRDGDIEPHTQTDRKKYRQIKNTDRQIKAVFFGSSITHYRRDGNWRWGGTQKRSTHNYSPYGLFEFGSWGIIMFLGQIEEATPGGFSDFDPWAELWSPLGGGVQSEKIKKIKKNFFPFFNFFWQKHLGKCLNYSQKVFATVVE